MAMPGIGKGVQRGHGLSPLTKSALDASGLV